MPLDDPPVTRARSRSGSRGRRTLGELPVNAAGGPLAPGGKKGAVVKRAKASETARAKSGSSGSGGAKGKRKAKTTAAETRSGKKRKASKREEPGPLSAAEIHASLMVQAKPRPASVTEIAKDAGAFRDFYNPDLHQHYLNLEATEEYKPVTLGFLTENGLNERMRAIIVDWMVESADDLKMDNSTVALAVSVFDRSLAKFSTPRSMLPCLASACLLVAGKIEMIYPPAVEDLYYLTDQGNVATADRIFGPEDVIVYEGKVCNKLGWRINFVTVQHYRVRLKEAAKLNKRETGLMDYLLDLSLLDSRCSSSRPSKVAAACCYLAMRTFRRSAPWTADMVFYSTYEARDLHEIVNFVHSRQVASEEASNRAIFTKYRSSSRDRTSLVTALLTQQLFP